MAPDWANMVKRPLILQPAVNAKKVGRRSRSAFPEAFNLTVERKLEMIAPTMWNFPSLGILIANELSDLRAEERATRLEKGDKGSGA